MAECRNMPLVLGKTAPGGQLPRLHHSDPGGLEQSCWNRRWTKQPGGITNAPALRNFSHGWLNRPRAAEPGGLQWALPGSRADLGFGPRSCQSSVSCSHLLFAIPLAMTSDPLLGRSVNQASLSTPSLAPLSFQLHLVTLLALDQRGSGRGGENLELGRERLAGSRSPTQLAACAQKPPENLEHA